MARITAFRGVRYAKPDGTDLSSLTAPPYDVISPDQREALLRRDEHNVVALELPEGPLDPSATGNRYETGSRRWNDWIRSGVLAFDEKPRIYVLAQRYRHGSNEIVRRGFIAAVGLESFSAGVVLPHERTLPKALGDRFNLTRATAANLSQVFGMFADPDHVSDALLDKAMSTTPIAVATDDEGVVSTLWALDDPGDHATLSAHLSNAQIFIADGHHRYTTALAYRDERRAAEGDGAPGDAAYDSVMMALVNMDDPGLIVHPTHRLADASGSFDPAAFWSALSEHFDVRELGPGHAAAALDAALTPSFIVRTRDGATRLVALRDDIDHSNAFPAETSAPWRSLDVAVLQELILSPILDIHPDRPETLERLSFSKDAHDALKAATEHDAVFVLRPTRMEQVAAVALAGETMPQKSTYFYPKLLSGLVFKSLEQA